MTDRIIPQEHPAAIIRREREQEIIAKAFGWNTPEEDDAEFARMKAAYNAQPCPACGIPTHTRGYHSENR